MPWWDETLARWSAALQFVPAIAVHSGCNVRKTGAWWRADGEWCVALDQRHYARCGSWRGEDSARAALGWTLQLAFGAHRACAEERLRAVVQEMLSDSDVRLLERMSPHPASTALPLEWQGAEPGYFVLVTPVRQASVATVGGTAPLATVGGTAPLATVGGTASIDTFDTFDTLDAVFDAYLPGVRRLHLLAGEDAPAVLLYLCPRQFAAELGDGDLRAADTPTQFDELSSVRSATASLASIIAADAMLSCRIHVSRRVHSPLDAQGALASLLLTSRIGGRMRDHRPVLAFGDEPMLHLLQALAAAGRASFLEAAAVRSATGQLRLPEDLAQALQGIVSANLNVSEAARMLYLHRNTLLHRIERIKAQTGYDVRIFADAATLWLAQQLFPD